MEAHPMNTKDLLTGAGLGAALTFIFDPGAGGRRRALVRDKMTHASRVTRERLSASARDIGNRARGVVAATRARLSDGDVSDVVLVERVRAKVGRACSHPRALDVIALNGEVTLQGPILANEMDDLVARAASVRGVQRVINELDPHESAEGVSSLQGGRVAERSRDINPRGWVPAPLALVSVVAAGLGVAAYVRRRRTCGGATMRA
jgi:hypothetical protein